MNQQPAAPPPATPDEEATRPAFQPPRPAGPTSNRHWGGHQPTASQPRPPTHNLPVRVPPNPPPSGGDDRITPLGWALRGAVLVGVSIVSGLVWLALNPGDGSQPEAGDQPPKTQNVFSMKKRVEESTHCEDVSTEQIQEFFAQHPCEHLTRALYTTRLADGEQVLTSLVSVRMPDAASAKALNTLVTQDSTGNVKDLATDATDLPDDFPELDEDLGYDSQQQNDLVVVGESAYFSNPDHEDARLKSVTTDALKLARTQDSN